MRKSLFTLGAMGGLLALLNGPGCTTDDERRTFTQFRGGVSKAVNDPLSVVFPGSDNDPNWNKPYVRSGGGNASGSGTTISTWTNPERRSSSGTTISSGVNPVRRSSSGTTISTWTQKELKFVNPGKVKESEGKLTLQDSKDEYFVIMKVYNFPENNLFNLDSTTNLFVEGKGIGIFTRSYNFDNKPDYLEVVRLKSGEKNKRVYSDVDRYVGSLRFRQMLKYFNKGLEAGDYELRLRMPSIEGTYIVPFKVMEKGVKTLPGSSGGQALEIR